MQELQQGGSLPNGPVASRATEQVHLAAPCLPIEDAPEKSPVFGSHEKKTSDILASTPILEALQQLHMARGRSVQPVRDVLETVIHRAEAEVARGQENVDARAVGRILQELDELDERFLSHIQTHVPAVIATLSHIAHAGEARVLPPQALEPIFDEIDRLSEAAERVSAANISLFLHGLRTFLRVTAQHKPSAVRERLAAVKERLEALVPLAQQWVDVGRVERAAIFEILPVA